MTLSSAPQPSRLSAAGRGQSLAAGTAELARWAPSVRPASLASPESRAVARAVSRSARLAQARGVELTRAAMLGGSPRVSLREAAQPLLAALRQRISDMEVCRERLVTLTAPLLSLITRGMARPFGKGVGVARVGVAPLNAHLPQQVRQGAPSPAASEEQVPQQPPTPQRSGLEAVVARLSAKPIPLVITDPGSLARASAHLADTAQLGRLVELRTRLQEDAQCLIGAARALRRPLTRMARARSTGLQMSWPVADTDVPVLATLSDVVAVGLHRKDLAAEVPSGISSGLVASVGVAPRGLMTDLKVTSRLPGAVPGSMTVGPARPR